MYIAQFQIANEECNHVGSATSTHLRVTHQRKDEPKDHTTYSVLFSLLLGQIYSANLHWLKRRPEGVGFLTQRAKLIGRERETKLGIRGICEERF